MDFSKRNGFKETAIGTIPEDWEVTKLENLVLDKIGGEWGTENKESPEEIGCYVLRGTDFSKAAVGKFDNVPFRYVKNKIYEKKKLEEGEVLVELSGGSKDQPTGRIFLITYDLMKDTSKTILFSNFVKKLKLKKTAVYPEYFYRYWQFLYNQGKTSVYEKRTTGIRNFKYNDFLENEFIPLPPLPEQKKIAAVLSAVQEAKEKTEAVIKATKELKKSLMKHLFTYGPVSPKEAGNVALKETAIGTIPEDWEVVKLIDAFEFSRKPRDLSISKDDLIPFIPMEYIPDEKIFVNKYDSKKIEEIGSGTFFLKGDLLVAKITPSFENGKQCLVRELPTDFGYATTEVWPIHATDKGNILYLFYYLKRDDVRVSISSKMEGSTGRQRVPKKVLENLLLPLPPLPIQQKIAEILSAVDKKIEAEENKKKSLEDLFKTLLNDLMTGKIRVNNLEV
jgi:type I restriction enzyme S subunit